MSDDEAAEFYRDKLAEWMNSQDIPTGSEGNMVDDLLEVLGAYIAKLRREHEDAVE